MMSHTLHWYAVKKVVWLDVKGAEFVVKFSQIRKRVIQAFQ